MATKDKAGKSRKSQAGKQAKNDAKQQECSEAPTTAGRPVDGFPMTFEWHTGVLQQLFDAQTQMLQDAIVNAIADDRSIIYLSCPISPRGGGFSDTNVDVARYVERRLLQRFGERVWVLNPARYQMESKSGRGYFKQHAERLGIGDEQLDNLPTPSGGDYMRMWTRVLVEDGEKNLGRRFDAYYFLGPEDVAAYFAEYGGDTLSNQIENYLAGKLATDDDFIQHFAFNELHFNLKGGCESKPAQKKPKSRQQRVQEFIRFYLLRASATFSKGCHDEWNIFRQLNQMRHESNKNVGDLLAGFFDGRQIAPVSKLQHVVPGYAIN